MPRMMSPASVTRVMPTMPMRMNLEPEMRMNLERARVRLQEMRPMIERSMRDVEPRVRMQLENIRPQLERIQVAPRARTNWLDA